VRIFIDIKVSPTLLFEIAEVIDPSTLDVYYFKRRTL